MTDEIEQKIRELEMQRRLVQAEHALWNEQHPLQATFWQGMTFCLPVLVMFAIIMSGFLLALAFKQ